QALLQLLQRFMQYRGPTSAAEIARQLEIDTAQVRHHLNLLVEASQLSCGEYRPDGHELEYCAPLILARLHRESLRRTREQIAPVSLGQYANFLPMWQGLDRQAQAAARHALNSLLHLPLTQEQWQVVLTAS